MDTNAAQIYIPDRTIITKRGPYEKSVQMNESLMDSPIYNEEQMQAILDGIAQNIWQKMDATGLKITALSTLSTVPITSLSRVFNYKAPISLKSLIKLAYALDSSPVEFFPNDLNRRKTNGDRFEEITRGMNLASVNYLLDMAAGFSRLKN